MNLFDRLLGKQAEREQQQARNFYELTIAVADGTIKAEDKILDALRDLGSTPLELQKALAQLTERRRLQEQLKGEADHRAQLQKVEARLVAIGEETIAAKKKWTIEERQLSDKRNALMARLSGFENVKAKLRASFVDGAIVDEEKGILQQQRDLNNEARSLHRRLSTDPNGTGDTPASLSALRSHRRAAEVELADARTKRQKVSAEAKVQKLSDQIGTLEQRLRPLQARLAETETEMARNNGRLTELSEAKLQPV